MTREMRCTGGAHISQRARVPLRRLGSDGPLPAADSDVSELRLDVEVAQNPDLSIRIQRREPSDLAARKRRSCRIRRVSGTARPGALPVNDSPTGRVGRCCVIAPGPSNSARGEFAEEVGGGDAAVHEDVASGDERAVGSPSATHRPPPLRQAYRPGRPEELDHASVALTAHPPGGHRSSGPAEPCSQRAPSPRPTTQAEAVGRGRRVL